MSVNKRGCFVASRRVAVHQLAQGIWMGKSLSSDWRIVPGSLKQRIRAIKEMWSEKVMVQWQALGNVYTIMWYELGRVRTMQVE